MILTHFEYISVAVALVIALIVGRLVGAIPIVLESQRRYWIHAGWVAVMLLVVVMQWWTIWNLKEVEWTPFRFLWALLLPATVLVRAIVLVGTQPNSIESYKTHFFDVRVRFFAIGLLISVEIGLGPWVFGNVASAAPVYLQAGLVALLSIVGIAFSNARVQAVVMLASLLPVLNGMFLLN